MHANAAGAASATSTSSTVPASTPDAIANARRGCEQAKALEESRLAQPDPAPKQNARPGILRVNSVPVLSPHTPVEKIRRTFTPTPAPVLPGQNNNASACEPNSATDAIENADEGQKKKKKKMKKRRHVHARTDTPVDGEEPEPTATPSTVQYALPPSPADNTTVHTSVVQAESTAVEGNKQPPENTAVIQKRDRLTACKAAPKPSLAPRVKQQNTPERTDDLEEAARAQAAKDSLARSRTASQLALTPTTLQGSFAAGADEPPQDLEQLLDKEIKKEPCPAASDGTPDQGPGTVALPPAKPAAPAAPADQPMPPASQEPVPPAPAPDSGAKKNVSFPEEPAEGSVPKRRREKTPAEKAAHARYMRFSRSFNSSLAFTV